MGKMFFKNRTGIMASIFLVVFLVTSICFTGMLFADTNLIVNGDFSAGNANWSTDHSTNVTGSFTFEQGVVKVRSNTYNSGGKVWIYQTVVTSNKSLDLYFDTQRYNKGYNNLSSIKVGADLFMGANQVGNFEYNYAHWDDNFPIGTWYKDNFLKLDFSGKPDFDSANIYFAVDYAGEAWFDNIRIPGGTAAVPITPDEWVDLNLDMGQLVNHYGATSTGFLGMLYDNSMQRIPDTSGLNYWNEQLTGGVFGANKVVEHFLFSDEIGAKVAAMTNEEYVSYLYTTLLSRNSDTDGYNNWLGYINSGFSKEETLRAFLNNEEWINICKLFNVTP